MHVANLIYEALMDERIQLKERSHEEQRVISEIIKKLKTEKYKLLVRLAALLHDVGHGPFSHSFEEVLERNPHFRIKRKDLLRLKKMRAIRERDKALWKRFVPKLLTRHEHFTILVLLRHREKIEAIIPRVIHFEDILRLLTGKTGNNEALQILAAIISGDVDADRIDYLLRDTHHVGFRHSRIELPNLVNQLRLIYFRTNHKKWLIGVSRDGVLSVEALLISRKYHYDRIATNEEIRKHEQNFVRRTESALSKLPFRGRIEKIADFFVEGGDSDVTNFLEHFYGRKFYELMNEFAEYESVLDIRWIQFTPQIRYDLFMIWRIGEKKKDFERYFENALKDMLGEDFFVDLYFHGKLPTFSIVSAVAGFRFLYDYSVIIGDFPLVMYENGGIRIYIRSRADISEISEKIESAIFAARKSQRLLYSNIFRQVLLKLTGDIRRSYTYSKDEGLRRCRDLDLLMSLVYFVHQNLTSNDKMFRQIRKDLTKKFGRENSKKIQDQTKRRRMNLGIRTSIYKFIYDARDFFSYRRKMKPIRVPVTGTGFYYCTQAYEDLQTLRALGLITEKRHLYPARIKPKIRWHTPMFYYSLSSFGESYIRIRKEMQKMARAYKGNLGKLQSRLEEEIQKMAKL